MSNEELGETANLAAWCKGCRGLMFVAADLPEMAKDNAKEISKAIKRGYRIGTVLTKEVWAMPSIGCKCKNGKAE